MLIKPLLWLFAVDQCAVEQKLAWVACKKKCLQISNATCSLVQLHFIHTLMSLARRTRDVADTSVLLTC